MDVREYNQVKQDLMSVGFSPKYVDEWGPKITLYRHKPSYNQSGVVVADVGTFVKCSGDPIYVRKKAGIGLLPWKPMDGCSCQWCQARDAQRGTKAQEAEVVPESALMDEVTALRKRLKELEDVSMMASETDVSPMVSDEEEEVGLLRRGNRRLGPYYKGS